MGKSIALTATFTTPEVLSPQASAELGGSGRHFRALRPGRYRLDVTVLSESVALAVLNVLELLTAHAGEVDVQAIHAVNRNRPPEL